MFIGLRRSMALTAFAFAAALPAIPTAQAPPTTFPPGSGSGQAFVSAVQLRSSGVSVAVVLGRANARYQGAQGNAEASAIDPGILGTSLEVPILCGRSLGESLPPDAIPPPLVLSSGGGPASEERAVAGGGEGPVTFGSQQAAVAPNARAVASVTGGTIAIPGLITVSGGTTTSSAELEPGAQRSGRSRTELGSVDLAGGLVRMSGLVWNAESLLGAETHDQAGFSASSLTLAGLPLPASTPAEFAASLGQINRALEVLGITLRAPEVVAGDAGRATVTPMGITVTPTPALLVAVAPLAEAIQPTRSALLALLDPYRLGDDCGVTEALGFGYLIADLILASMSSGGGVDLLFGGASASTTDTAFANPFGPGLTPAPPHTAVAPLPAPAAPAPVAAPVASPPSPSRAAPVAAGRPMSTTASSCRTTHPFGSPSCSDGAARVAGLVSLGAVAALAGLDHRRRSRTTTSRGPA